MLERKDLTDPVKITIAKKLSDAIINKQHEHPGDMWRAAVVLYTANASGYPVKDLDIKNIIEKLDDADEYSHNIIKRLEEMANAYNDLVHGLGNPENDHLKIT